MSYGRLEKHEAKAIFDRYEANNRIDLETKGLSEDEKNLRKHFDGDLGDILRAEDDFALGMNLYTGHLCPESIGIRTAADDGFWRNLTCRIVPNHVLKRWPAKEKDGALKWNASRFYSMPQRNWLKIVWWICHLGWQGTREETEKVLAKLGKDSISQVVERTGGGRGYPVDLYREIIRQTCESKNDGKTIDEALNKALALHLMRSQTTIPEFYEGGMEKYAKDLLAAG